MNDPVRTEPDRAIVTLQASDGNALESLSTSHVIDLFQTHGALLLSGFRFDLASFTAFTRRFCSRFVRNESGRRMPVSRDGTTQTVNLGHEPFPLHPELSRVPWRPDIAWFACARPPAVGGETLVCDGLAVVPRLSAALRARLANRALRYREETPMDAFTQWLGVGIPDDGMLARLSATSPFGFERRGSRIFRSFTRPFLHQPLFSDAPAFGNFLLFARYMLRTNEFPTFEDGTLIPDDICTELKAATDALTIAHRWRAGDVLMLDNSRFMHGRNTVTDPGERVIWTQFGYAGFLPADDPRQSEPWRHTNDPRAIFFGPDALARS
jgi:alpha-ketoglutarate-dependent taurine dioxygenase